MADVKMVQLRNIASDAVVSVTEEKAARMGSQWEPAESDSKKSAAKRSSTAKK